MTAAFLKHNNLELVIRSHEVKEDGYEIEHNNQLITGQGKQQGTVEQWQSSTHIQTLADWLTDSFRFFFACVVRHVRVLCAVFSAPNYCDQMVR